MPAAMYALSAGPRTPGAWPSTWSVNPVVSFETSASSPAMTPGKFIISATPIVRWRRSRHARRRHHVDVEGQVGAAIEQPVDAVGAEHVGDLVRVGHHRSGAMGQ